MSATNQKLRDGAAGWLEIFSRLDLNAEWADLLAHMRERFLIGSLEEGYPDFSLGELVRLRSIFLSSWDNQLAAFSQARDGLLTGYNVIGAANEAPARWAWELYGVDIRFCGSDTSGAIKDLNMLRQTFLLL